MASHQLIQCGVPLPPFIPSHLLQEQTCHGIWHEDPSPSPCFWVSTNQAHLDPTLLVASLTAPGQSSHSFLLPLGYRPRLSQE